MALQGTVAEAKDGAEGFDTDCPVRPGVARQFAAGGYSFCARYLARGERQGADDLSPLEAAGILAAGLALMAVQHVAAEGWTPGRELGKTYGSNAAAHALAIGLPAGINVWCDLECVATGTASADVAGYCEAWFEAVQAAGFVPGLYVGANCGLTAQQLLESPFQHFWKSESKVPPLSGRGYQIVQSAVASPVHGLSIDRDVAQADRKGGRALWLAPGEVAGRSDA